MFSDKTETNANQEQEQEQRTQRHKRTRSNARADEAVSGSDSDKVAVRNRLFSVGSADAGRSGEFVKYLKEILKEKDEKNTFVFQPSGELAANLSSDLGFVVFGYYQNDNFVYHLNVFESEAKSVRETESKESRRVRREEDKVYLYESLNDAIDDSIYELFEDHIKDEFDVKGEVISSGVSIIPVELNLEDVSKLTLMAYDNEDSNILMSSGMQPFTSEDLSSKSTTKVSMDFVPQTNAKTLSGLPLRSDLQVKIGEHVKDQKGSSARRTNGVNPIISYDGFVNPRWVGVDPDDEKAPLAAYIAEVVMSNVNPYTTQKFAGNFERLLLAIGSMAFFKENDAFLKGLELNLNSDIRLSSLQYGIDDIEDVSFDDIDDDSDNARKFLESVLVSDKRRSNYMVEFAMLVREGDIGASTQKIFVDAYNGDESALNRIREGIDDLCNCEDAVIIDGPEDIFSGAVTIPYGYFQKSNQTLSSDVIDTLYVMDQCGKNFPEVLDDYLDAMDPTGEVFDIDTAQTKLVQTYNKVTDGQFVHKGFALKVQFNPDFIAALARKLVAKNSGLALELDTNVNFRTRRGRSNRSRRETFGLSGNVTGSRNRSSRDSGRSRGRNRRSGRY